MFLKSGRSQIVTKRKLEIHLYGLIIIQTLRRTVQRIGN